MLYYVENKEVNFCNYYCYWIVDANNITMAKKKVNVYTDNLVPMSKLIAFRLQDMINENQDKVFCIL